MKNFFSILLLTSAAIHFANAQSSVAIGDSSPKASAVLYLKGNGSQGLIIPIVSNTSSIATPESGMIVYNSGDKKVYYHDGAAWTAIGGGSGGGSPYTLSISGNNLLLKDAAFTVSTVPIAASTPTAANQFLTWDGAKWVGTTFTQDAANVNGAITVNGIKGKVLPALPSTTQVLVYNGTAWVFQALTGSTDSQDLTLNATTNSLSLTNDATPVDLTPYKQNLTIAGSNLSISGGNSVTLPGTTYTGGTGITVAGTVITNTGDTNAADDLTATSTAAGDVTGIFSNLQIASGSVTSTEILDGAIAGADLATNINIATTGNITTSAPGNLSIAGTSTLNGAATLTTLAGAGTRMVVANPTGVLSTVTLPVGGWGLTGNSATNAATNFVGTSDSQPLVFRTNATEAMRVLADGKVGIATSTPTQPLDVVGNVKFSGAIMPNNLPGETGQVLTSAGPDVAPTWATISGGALTTANVIPKGDGNAQIASQLFDTGTNVGIGTTTPLRKLDINGDLNFSTGSSIFVNNVRVFNNAGTSNTFLGSNAGINTTGNHNTFFGFDAGRANTTGVYNLHIGRGAGVSSAGASYNVFVGADAGANLITGSLNTMVGFNAGFESDDAISNTFVGNKAGLSNTSADFNTFIGERSAEFNTTGAENTFVGRTTGAANLTGLQNTLIGTNANVGSGALQNATAIGYRAFVGASNSLVLGSINGVNGATSSTNVGIGTSTPHAQLHLGNAVSNRKIILFEAADNVHEFIGFGVEGTGALRYQTADPANDHVFYSAIDATSSLEIMRIGGTGRVGIGRVATTNQLEISGNASKATAGGWVSHSDRRIKTDIRDIDNSLELIKSIRPVKYKYTEEWKRRNPSIKDQYYYSFIAQEYQKVFPEAVQGSGEYLDGDKNEILQIDTHNAQMVTIKAVQEQQKIIETQQNEIDNLKKELAEIKNYLSMEAKVVKKKKGRK